MVNRRDNFTQKTIEILRNRVAHRCSNPECRVVTTGPTIDPDKVNYVGEAAHICAAAPRGPRYNKSMTRDQRKSIDNALWLCSNCADKIDKDPKRYPVELLQEWKRKSQIIAHEEMGKTLPTVNEPLEILLASMTGEGLKSFPSRLENLSLAASRYLEEVDPRIAVNIAFDKNNTIFNFAAKEEPIEMKMTMITNDGDNFKNVMDDLFIYGIPIETSVDSFNFSGSPIFDKLQQPVQAGAKISFTPKGIDARLRFKLQKENDCQSVDDMIGAIYTGKDNFTFRGELFNGLLHFDIRSPFMGGVKSSSSKFNFKLNLEQWENVDVSKLPYFNKTYEFFQKLFMGYSLGGEMEIEGEKLLSLQDKVLSDDLTITEMYSIFRYIYLARKISEYFERPLLFSPIEFYYSDIKKMEHIVKAIEKYQVELKEGDAMTFSIVIESDEHLNSLNKYSKNIEPIHFKVVEPSYSLNIYGEKIMIPQTGRVFTRIRLNETKKYDLKKVGDSVEFEYIADKEAFYSMEFVE